MLPLVNLHFVPDDIPGEMAVFTEPLAAAGEILEQVEISCLDRVLVIGAGRLGQLIAMVLLGTGCQLEVVARHPRQRELLTRMGISTLSEQDLGSRKYDLIIEATGSADGFSLACKYIHPRGTIVLKSTYKGDTAVNFSAIVVDEVTLVGSRCGPFETALELMSAGRADPRCLIDASYPLDQGLAAFEHAARPGALKILLTPGSKRLD